MQKLTCFAVALSLLGVTPGYAANTPPDRGAELVRAHPSLSEAIIKAKTAGEAATAIRRIATAARFVLSDGDIVTALIALSDIWGGKDRYDHALRLGRYALELTTVGTLGPGLEFDSLTRVGGALYNMDDFDGAARELDAARRAAARIVPFDANSVANATANYAVVLDNAGRYREAESALIEAIALRRQAAEQRPASIAIAWLALAAVHKRMGRPDLSEQDYRTALTLLETAGQRSSRTYGSALHNYGVLLGERGRDAEAAALYRRAIDLLPADQRFAPRMVNDYTSLSAALIELRDLENAEVAVRNAERAASDAATPNSARINILSARASLAESRGDYAAAERDAAAAVALSRTTYGAGHREIVESLLKHARLLVRVGKADAADTAATEAAAASRPLPDSNPLKAVALDVVAEAQVARGQRLVALAASRAAAEAQARVFVEESGHTPAPLPPEERGIIARRIALLWDADRQ